MADDRIELLREESRRYFEEEREVTRWMIAVLEQQAESMREMRDELRSQREEAAAQREEAAAQREGFFSLIDELKRHGLGGPPPAPA